MNPSQQIFKLLFGSIDCLRYKFMRANPPPANITHAQIKVMGCIFRHPDNAMMLKDLAYELNLTPAAVSQTVEVLVNRGTVIRQIAPDNRRAVNIRLSAKGQAIKQQLDVFFEGAIRQSLQGVAEDKLLVFIEVLQQLNDQLQAQKNEPGQL